MAIDLLPSVQSIHFLRASDGCVTDRGIRVLESPALHLLLAPSLFMVTNFGGGYRTSYKGAQPPPVPTVQAAVDDELSRLLQCYFFSSNGAGINRQNPAPITRYAGAAYAISGARRIVLKSYKRTDFRELVS